MAKYHNVEIDGVRYVPVSNAHIKAADIEDSLVSTWGGDKWRTDYPDAMSYLRVIVSDTFDDDESETIPEVVARILEAAGG